MGRSTKYINSINLVQLSCRCTKFLENNLTGTYNSMQFLSFTKGVSIRITNLHVFRHRIIKVNPIMYVNFVL